MATIVYCVGIDQINVEEADENVWCWDANKDRWLISVFSGYGFVIRYKGDRAASHLKIALPFYVAPLELTNHNNFLFHGGKVDDYINIKDVIKENTTHGVFEHIKKLLKNRLLKNRKLIPDETYA